MKFRKITEYHSPWNWKYYLNFKKQRHSLYQRLDINGEIMCQGQYNNGTMFGVWKGIIEIFKHKQPHIFTTKEVYHGMEIIFN